MNFTDLRPGHSVAGDEIIAFRSENKASKYIYLIAGVHGDEVEGVYVLNQLVNWLKENEEIELPFIVIPNLNIDGYIAGTRTNSHAVDLNRNFPTTTWKKGYKEKRYFPGEAPLSEPENKYLLKLFGKFPPKLIFTFHSWIPMVNYNGDCKSIAEAISKVNNYPVVAEDIEGHPTPGSLGDYAKEELKVPVVTLECPVLADDKGLKEIWLENKDALIAAISLNELKEL
ncbi:MAG: DUF2817 domain-containing protein [Bacteriovoracaceae bacterium]|nr:DUF2817 domain-containing protein [Bacteriovoracaceae bacterium]